MWLIALEAFVALCMLLLIVWLTMGSSRRRQDTSAPPPGQDKPTDDGPR